MKEKDFRKVRAVDKQGNVKWLVAWSAESVAQQYGLTIEDLPRKEVFSISPVVNETVSINQNLGETSLAEKTIEEYTERLANHADGIFEQVAELIKESGGFEEAITETIEKKTRKPRSTKPAKK